MTTFSFMLISCSFSPTRRPIVQWGRARTYCVNELGYGVIASKQRHTGQVVLNSINPVCPILRISPLPSLDARSGSVRDFHGISSCRSPMISRSRHLLQISCCDAFESESTWTALRAREKNHPNSYTHWLEEQCCMRCPALLHLKRNSDASPTST